MKKVMAIIKEPQSCTECYFQGIKWAHPCWSTEKPDTLGVYCQIDPDKKIYEFEFEETGYKMDCCPLKELPQYIKGNPRKDYNKMYKAGYNACLDNILDK